MRIVIVYATLEGHTGKIEGFARSHLEDAGHAIRLMDTGSGDVTTLEGAEAVILAAPVHERRHPAPFEDAVRALGPELAARPTLMLSVSLKAAFAEGREEAQDYLDEMKLRCGVTFTAEILVPGAVMPRSYDYFEKEVVRSVVLRGQDIGSALERRDFTDWDALGRALTDFVGRV
ncbi:flavodoxin domain-containing protein [Tropicimonas sp. IMCC34011]|uniref:flavodoxin domain-containing protein n=1 Tax=Tropicimonas sp. IMCC34011 TaxID=2248759 RepID=UPI000E233D8A|nr:flavodoxin domain-containing protein [Tropicimonas sp. IMCC34011]